MIPMGHLLNRQVIFRFISDGAFKDALFVLLSFYESHLSVLVPKFVQKYQINQSINPYIMNYSQIIHNILFLLNICMLSLIYREAGEAFQTDRGFGKIT